MIKTKLFPFLVLQLFLNQYIQGISRNENEDVYNSLDILFNLTKDLKYLENNFDDKKFYSIVDNIDIFCSGIIIDTMHKDVNVIIKLVGETQNLDNIFPRLTLQLKEFLSEIIVNEFRFRSLVAVQHQLDFLNRNLPDLDRLISLAEFATVNQELSTIKTRLINRQVQILSFTTNKNEKLRCWSAIQRMLNEIDIIQSETESQIIQRSPYGLMIKPGILINKLNEQNKIETNTEIKKYSDKVLMQLESAESKYKELNDTITFEYKSEEKIAKKRPAMEALQYFDKAFLSDNNNERILLYGKAIENDSTFTAAYNNRGLCYYIAGEYQKAVGDFKKLLNLDSSYLSLYTNLGLCYYQLGDFKESIYHFTRALKGGEKELIIFTTRGMCYQKLNNFTEAIKDYSSAIILDSISYSAYSNRAECYKRLKKTNEVINDYKKLIELDPGNSTQYYNLGCIYFNRRNWKQAIKYWEGGLKVNPNDPNIQSYLPKAKKYLEEKR